MTSRFDLGWWRTLDKDDIGLMNWSCIIGKLKDRNQMALICEHNKTHSQVIIIDDGTVEKNGDKSIGQKFVCPPVGACKMLSNW